LKKTLAAIAIAAFSVSAFAIPHFAVGTEEFTYAEAQARYGLSHRYSVEGERIGRTETFALAGLQQFYFDRIAFYVADHRSLQAPYNVSGVQITTFSDHPGVLPQTMRYAYDSAVFSPGGIGLVVLKVELPEWTTSFVLENYYGQGSPATNIGVWYAQSFILPEPSPVALIGAGLAGLIWVRRRKDTREQA
jgi:hypothetical protein